jgi:hypothetical protein
MSALWRDGDEEGSCLEQASKPVLGGLAAACFLFGVPVVGGAVWSALMAIWRAWWGV